MTESGQAREIPLSEAALRLRSSIQAALSDALRGDLSARRDARGRWMVDAASCEQLRRARQVDLASSSR